MVPTPAVADLLHRAFDQARHYGRSDPHVPLALLEILAAVGVRARQPGLRRELQKHAEAVHRSASAALDEASDRDRLDAAFETAKAAPSS